NIFLLISAFASEGPVFIKPDTPPVSIEPAATKEGNYVTQTVYGFLDFTTTIGNTVMVFSPQSAETAKPDPPQVTKDISSNHVIETKPLTPNKEVGINPSKTQVSNENKPPATSKKVSSVVHVQANPSQSITPKLEVKSSPSVKINVVEGKPATSGPAVVSKVQASTSIFSVVEGPKGKATASPNIITKVEVVSGPTKSPKQDPIIASKVDIHTGPSVVSSVVQVKSDEEPAAVIGNNIGEPEYDFLSRQPSEVVEETYKVINLKPSSKFHLKHRPSTDVKKATKRSDAAHPTGLVTKLGGTVVKDGVTTVHETSVIGTYISGKYAQVLQSTSHITNNAKAKINPSPTLRILKTAAPTLGKGNKHNRQHLDPTPAAAINEEASVSAEAGQNTIKSTRKPNGSGSSFKRFKNRHKETEVTEENKEQEAPQPQPSYKKAQKNRASSTQSGRNAKEQWKQEGNIFPHGISGVLHRWIPHEDEYPGAGIYLKNSGVQQSYSLGSYATFSSEVLPSVVLKTSEEDFSLIARQFSGRLLSKDKINACSGVRRFLESLARHNTSSHSPQKSGRSGRNRNRKTTTTTTTPSAHSEETTPAPSFGSGKRFSGRKNKQSRAAAVNSENNSNNNSNGGHSRRGYKPKVQASSVDQTGTSSSSLYKFKLNRSPGRWQYKTTSKPRVTIRKQNNDESTNNNGETSGTTSSSIQEASQPQINDVVTPQARSDDVDSLEGSESIASIIDDESSKENKLDTPAFPVETIKVEISTPPDLADIYYEIATIKTPYTFQVGSVKNTRYVTVTSTFEKSFETPEPTSTKATEPLTENILATSSNYAKDNNFLDSSIATLPPIYLASDMETPPLETLTETFSTTQTMLKTHILPVIRNGNDTTSSTLVQTYIVTRLVTATKTLPPMDAYNFIPSKTLNEFNSRLDEAGSELHLELEFGDQNEQDEGQVKRVAFQDLDLANIGSNFDLSDVDKSKLLEGHLRLKKAHTPSKPTINELTTPAFNPDQLQQLALLRLLNPAAAQGQVITTSKPVLKVETLYETHVLPVTQGQNTILSTISKIKGTFTKTDFEFGTSTIPPALPIPPVVPQIPQIPQIPQLNPFIQPQPQFAVTSSPIVQSTVVTQTNSKVLKLTFGAKTAYTTVFSTTVVPTVLTTYMTASVPVAPTAAYPGYYPAPFPAGYPYVG
ncbi:hypothetical protein NQ315_016507, partial [Exocentrus adspersus]